jgi:predicted nucleotidyltransferase component of viral defense system
VETDRRAIELFHLIFVIHLGRRVDKALFAIKGGCNLRFYFHSVRYSEDIDFDIRTMAKTTLEGNVNTILKSTAIAQHLSLRQMEIDHVTAAKQTDTTQRWKVGLKLASGPVVPTKIEFSRRTGLAEGHVLEAVSPELVLTHGLPPVLAQHYSRDAAFSQKIIALSRRTEPQARDIFDLKVLSDAGAGAAALTDEALGEIPRAIENAMSLGFDAFSGQVRAFLADEYADFYGSRGAWEKIQNDVVTALVGRLP